MDSQNMSSSFNNLLPNFGDAPVEPTSKEDTRVIPDKVPPDDEVQNSLKMMDINESGMEGGSDDSSRKLCETARKEKFETDEMDELRGDGSADDMDLDETIDSHIGVRIENERRHHVRSLPSNNEIEEDEDDEMGMDPVNILDTLPLEGAPIEGQEVSEADLLGKIDDDDDEDERKSASRSDDEDNREVKKRKLQDEDSDQTKKKAKNDEDKEGGLELESKSDKKLSNMRRNIREVMDETQLDEATLAAQRQEMERLRRVQEQQRIIREIRLPSSVQLRVNSTAASGSQTVSQANLAPRRPLNETSRWQRGGYPASQTSLSRLPGRNDASSNTLQQRIRMMTPSVSISPVVSSKKEPIEHLEYYTDSDLSDVDDIEEVDEFALQEKQIQQARKLSGPPKPAKSKDVVTISSSSESENSDDDCIVLSDPSEAEETDTEDDPSNSGMHTNDRYNVPDDQGRVLVNVGHPENEPDVFLAPQIARIIKPHQIGGIRFLFDNIIESIERFKTSEGFGCILAHSMGLGKTLQVATFCDIFFRCTDAKTVLCIMPINTLQNWLAEFNMWLPYENPNKPKVEEKSNIKEEIQPGLVNPHQNPVNMMPDNSPYPGHLGYNPNLAPHYGSTGPPMYDPRYPPNYSGVPGYGPIKTEPSCHPQQMNPYGGIPQYPPNPNYSQTMQHPPNMQHPSNYPSMDHNMHPGMHGVSNQMTPSMYPGYCAPPENPYQNFGNKFVPEDPNIKKETDTASNQKTENNDSSVNSQTKEEPKKEAEEPKKEEDKKEKVTIKTPFSVDAPPDLEVRPRHFNLHILNDSHKTMAARARVICEWQRVGGVLLIGYELYRQLSLKKQNKAKKKKGQLIMFKDDSEEDNKNKPLLEDMHKALVNPGPDLVICDEGHRIKNSHASISLALKQMRTKRRIVLTGYPLQNNLLEYWCMVDFVRPNYLGTKSEFCNMFERPIQNGQCIDSTPQDMRLMRYRAHVLHALLEGFVQRRSHTVLQISLPRKEEFILLVRMTPHQRKLYDVFMNEVVKKRTVPNPLKAFAVCCKIWNHPDVLYHFLKKRQANEEDDLDLEETIGDKTTPTNGKRAAKPRQSKGDVKRGRKPKNKPEATIQPNSVDDNKNLNNDAQKQQPYQNFNTPVPPSPTGNSASFQTPNIQNSYQTSEYQNYRFDDNTSNYQTGDFYPNQNQPSQQKYPPTRGQNFPPYSQDSNYQPTNSLQQQQQQQQQPQQQQQFQGQHQNYSVPTHEVNNANSSMSQSYSGAPAVSNSTSNPQSFPQSQNQTMGISNTAGSGFTQSNYPYQDQGKNYPPSSTQDPNCPQVSHHQQHQQQQPPPSQQSNFQPHNQVQSQMSISEYGSYPPQNQNQAYSSMMNQPIQDNRFQSGAQQQNSNANADNNTAYMNNPSAPNCVPPNTSYPQNQQVSNAGPPSYQNLTTQPNQNAPLMQNQSQPYSMNQRENTNPSTNSTEVGFNQNQQSSQQSQAYQTNTSQSQMGGYQNTSQNQSSNYNINQSSGYSNDQQSQIHQHPTGFNQQASGFPPPVQQSSIPTGQMNYTTNQATSRTDTNILPHSYQADLQQQSQSNSTNQNPLNVENTYSTGSQNATENFSSANTQNSSTNQSADSQQKQQHHLGTPGHEQYWQKNYQNSNISFPNSNANQFEGNYANTIPMHGNYQNNPTNQINSQSKDFSVNSLTDNKPPQQIEYGQQQQQLPKVTPPNELGELQTQNNEQQINSKDESTNSNDGQNNPSILGPQKEADKNLTDNKDITFDKEKDEDNDDDLILKDESEKDKFMPPGLVAAMSNPEKDPGIPYDWAYELMKSYIPGLIDASAKMTIFFCILEESIRRGDRILTFSQSLFTLNLIEDFLARNSLKHENGETENWAKNVNYFRLDGSTSALEREKLINEFNANKKIHLFLVSTRAGSLGINLVGANRAIVFDASWNPCHDTQAVCRVYRYGQKKNCYVYRLVTDNCLEKKIYDRQINKQGMADRVVDQCNPDAHLSLKEAATLSWDWEEDNEEKDFSGSKEKYSDEVMQVLLDKYSKLLTKEPFHHESLLVDRKDRKLSQAEKKLARRGYELEKMAATNSKPSYNYIPGNTATRVSVSGGLHIRQIKGDVGGVTPKPVASVRPMQQRGTEGLGPRNPSGTRWIPAEVWQRQGMSAQEMTLPLDVVIPTNSPDKGSIVLKAGQKVMVLKSPKGIYMQLESGKIIAIRTALKINQQKKEEEAPKKTIAPSPQRTGNSKPDVSFPLRNNSAISIVPKTVTSNVQQQNRPIMRTGVNYRPFGEKEVAKRTKPIATAAAKPYSNQMNPSQVTLSRINKSRQENPSDVSSIGENSNSSDGHKVRTDQRVEEVRVEDLVGESGSNSDYSPSSRPSNSDTDSNLHRPMMENRVIPNYPLDTSPAARSQIMRTSQDNVISEPSASFIKSFEQNRIGGHPPEKKSEMMEKDSLQHQYPHEAFNPQPQIQQHHRMGPQSLTPAYQRMQYQSPQPQPQTQHITQAQYQQPQAQSPLPQYQKQPTQQLQQYPQQQTLHMSQQQQTLQMPQQQTPQPRIPQLKQPRQPATKNPPRPMLQRGRNKKNAPPPPVIPPVTHTVDHGLSPAMTGATPTNISSSRSKAPLVESMGSQTSEPIAPTEIGHSLPPQGYPYTQFPRYYDYEDPRSRPAEPYPPYYTGTPLPPHPSMNLPRVTPEKIQTSAGPPQPKLTDQASKPSNETLMSTYPRVSTVPSKNNALPETPQKTPAQKAVESESAGQNSNSSSGNIAPVEESHVPTAFSHPSSVRSSAYPPGPYPPAPYDPYSQHYQPPPPPAASSSAYGTGAAPGYGAAAVYGGGPSIPPYDPEYARMYSAFHGPPPPSTADPYRGYAPPPPAASNYYSSFPHSAPPPYPNYSFLPPYPNPNVPAEPQQPPAQ